MKHLIKYLDALENTFRFSDLGSDPKGQIGMIAYTSGYKYELQQNAVIETRIEIDETIETLFLWLNPNGRLKIQRGYAWDGPSGPTIDTRSSMRGSLVHDALYQLMRSGLLGVDRREAADNLMCNIFLEDGMWAWRARAWFRSVRKLAGMSVDPRSKKIVCYAGAK